ncbi:hypothetical protein BDB00DRAFT_87978 [Zychaea mexicana]|uniref:uncharacterized protein n=1 Tax=Zychaea mexicana TaxID=64656 RepID=UPI0022FE9BD5|nr:uncharacterized protein BDB00DRAFT_87978 [Zychaea mexicana]KAI9485157.1 hypothetical protein BDB00DRAFT_87978 [Zychaea mexicana]
MPLKTRGGRKGTGRRGRPKKYPRPGEGETEQLQQPLQPLHEDHRQYRENRQEHQHHQHPTQKQRLPSLSLNTSHHDANGHTAVRPREERSYKDYYPNLNLKEPLRIVRVSKSDRPATQDLTVDARTTNTSKNNDDNNVDSDANGGSGSTPLSTVASVAKANKDDNDRNDNGKERQVPELPPDESLEDSGLSSMSLNDSPKGDGSTTTAAEQKVNKGEYKNVNSNNNGSNPSPLEPEDEKNDISDEPANDEKSITSTDSESSDDSMVTADEGEDMELDEKASNKSGSNSEEVLSLSATPGEKDEDDDADDGGRQRNGDPLVDHQKEGDLYQALSTRPQQQQLQKEQQPLETVNDINMGVNLDALPKPSFRLVTEEPKQVSMSDDRQKENGKEVTAASTALTTVEDEGASSQQQRFQRPENHYIRYIEPSEADLMDTVEYDMDEHERRKEDLGEVSGDLFEAVMDQLEKEWFDLIKNLPKQVAEEPSLPEDSACAICDDTECENSNAIVFCDGCNLAVHQDCYGIPYIPEGQWLCRKCLVSPENPVSCIFCPNEGGAFKQTNTNKWGHLLCAIWIPEVGLSNSVYMEPIDNIENIPKSRWKLTCYICRRRQGACIQCDSKHCFVAFHVTCARWARLCMRMKSHGSHYDGVVFKAYCDKHTPRDYTEQVNVEQTVAAAQAFFSSSHRRSNKTSNNNNNSHRIPRQRYVDDEVMMNDSNNVAAIGDGDSNNNNDDEEDGVDGQDDGRKKKKKKHKKKGHMDNDNSAVTQMLPSSKAARAHQHHYSAGAPIAPEFIISKLENMRCVRQATNLRRKPQLIVSICRYWSLKRESRRGAPLLKRLHLEPWTASSSQHKQTEAMINLRADLERVRMLSEQVQKREKQKLERIRKQKAYLEMILFPVEYITKPLVDQLIDADKKELFRFPVTPDVAPDYSEIIDTPMSFAEILEKFSAHEYTSLEQVESDIMLIWKNCKTYNKPETLYYRTAERLEKLSLDLLAQARKDYEELEIKKETGILAIDIHPEIFTYNTVHVPSPEELAAEQERLEAEERAKAEERKRQQLAAEKAEAKKQADAERRRAKAAQAEAKRQKQLEYAAKRGRLRAEAAAAKAAAAAAAAAAAEEEENEMKQEGEDQVVANGTQGGDDDDSNHNVPENKNSRVATRSSKAAEAAASTATQGEESKGNTNASSNSSSKVLRRRTRSMGSDGLVAPTAQELEKRTSSEARNLLWHSDHVTEEDHPLVRPDRKRKAPPGWLYVEGTDTGNSGSDTDGLSPTPSPRKKSRSESRQTKPKPEPITDVKPEMIVWARVKGFPPHPARVKTPFMYILQSGGMVEEYIKSLLTKITLIDCRSE